MFLHFPHAIEFVSRIQKFFVIAAANQFVELRPRSNALCPNRAIQVRRPSPARDSCFATRRSSRLLQKFNFRFGKALFSKTLLSVSRNFRIDFKRPPFNPASQRFRFFDPLESQPRRGVQTAHAMMAIANHLCPLGSLAAGLQRCRNVDEVICYCHHGMRSLERRGVLRFQGIEKSENLWLAGLNGGRLKSIRKFRDTERSVFENKALPKTKIKFLQKPT